MADMSEREMKSEFGGGNLISSNATSPAFAFAVSCGWFCAFQASTAIPFFWTAQTCKGV
jgi:hypothetical protein